MDFNNNTQSKSSKSCANCSKKFAKYKRIPKCCICLQSYHPRCVELAPSDVNFLYATKCENSWICLTCNLNIFPFPLQYKEISENQSHIKPVINTNKPREFCKTCYKQGNILTVCELCDLKSHPRCFAGDLGCKSCLREIYPGYDVNIRELFNYNNNALFNPYIADLDINFIGNSGNEPDFEHLAWSNCADLLNNCNYLL